MMNAKGSVDSQRARGHRPVAIGIPARLTQGPRVSTPPWSASLASHEFGTAGKWWVLLSIGMGNFVSGVNSSVTNTVLPLIAREFQADISTVAWVLMAYLVVLSSLLLTFGRLGDVAGHRRIYLTGMAVTIGASMLGGAAPNESLLIGFRAIQACGSGMTAATGIVLVTLAFGPRDRGKAIGLQTSLTYFGMVIGPALGGLLAAAFGWRAVFYMNGPIGIVVILLGLRVLPRDTATARQAKFDVAGAATSFVMLTALLLGISQGQTWGWASGATLGSFAMSALAGVLFVRAELAHPEPMLDLGLFRDRLLTTSVISANLNYVATFFQNFLLPFYLVGARGLAIDQAGLLLMVSPVVMMLVAPQAGRLSDRIGSRLLTSCGMAILAVGLVALSQLGEHASTTHIIAAQLVIGVGCGMFSSPNTNAMMGEVPHERQGTAGGMQAVSRNVGMVLGVALAGAILSSRLDILGGPGHFIQAFHDTLLVGAGFALAGALLSLTKDAPTARGKPSS